MNIATSETKGTFIDLFCGSGGASLGFLQENFQLISAIDINKHTCKTYEANLSQKPIQADISKTSGEELMLGVSRGEIDLLIACPPCQGFTTIGKRLNKDDPRNELLKDYIRITADILPSFIVFENIHGMIRSETHFEYILNRLRKLGYYLTFSIVNMADYGVPQLRKRLIIFGTRLNMLEKKVKLPLPTHCIPTKVKKSGLKSWKTAHDAISNLPALKNGEKDPSVPNHHAPKHSEKVLNYIKRVPKNGGSRASTPKKYWHACHRNRKSGFENIMGRINWDHPGPTITSGCINVQSGRFIHPNQHRGITIREAARFQGFPDSFIFHGSKREQAAQVGNALPPPFARAIARQVKMFISH